MVNEFCIKIKGVKILFLWFLIGLSNFRIWLFIYLNLFDLIIGFIYGRVVMVIIIWVIYVYLVIMGDYFFNNSYFGFF